MRINTFSQDWNKWSKKAVEKDKCRRKKEKQKLKMQKEIEKGEKHVNGKMIKKDQV